MFFFVKKTTYKHTKIIAYYIYVSMTDTKIVRIIF